MHPISLLIVCASSILSFLITDISLHESAGLQYLSRIQIKGTVTSAFHLSSHFFQTLYLPASVPSFGSFHLSIPAHSFSTLYNPSSAPLAPFLSLLSSSASQLNDLFGSSLKPSDFEPTPGPVCLIADFNGSAAAVYEKYVRAPMVCFLSEAPLLSGAHALRSHKFHQSASIPSTILPPVSIIITGTPRKRPKAHGIRNDTCSKLDFGLSFEFELALKDARVGTDICATNDSPQLLPYYFQSRENVIGEFYVHATGALEEIWFARPFDGDVEVRSSYSTFYVVVGLFLVSAILVVYRTMRKNYSSSMIVLTSLSWIRSAESIRKTSLRRIFLFASAKISAAAWVDMGSVMEDEYLCAITYGYGDGNGSRLSSSDSDFAIGDGIAGMASLDEEIKVLDGDSYVLRASAKAVDVVADARSVVGAKEGGAKNMSSFELDLERKTMEMDGKDYKGGKEDNKDYRKDKFMTSDVVTLDCVVTRMRSDTSMLSWTSVYLPASQSAPSTLHMSDVSSMVRASSSPAGLDVLVNRGRDAGGSAKVDTVTWTSVNLLSSSSSPSCSLFTKTNLPRFWSSPAGLGSLLDKVESGAFLSDASIIEERVRSGLSFSWTSVHIPSYQSLPNLRLPVKADSLPHSESSPAALDEFVDVDPDTCLQGEEEGHMIYSIESAPADLWSGRIWDLPEPSLITCSASEPTFFVISEADTEGLGSEIVNSLSDEEGETLYSGLCSITKSGFCDVFTPMHRRCHSDFTQYVGGACEVTNGLSASLSGSICARRQTRTLWRNDGWWYAGIQRRKEEGEENRPWSVERQTGSSEDGFISEDVEADILSDEEQDADRIASKETYVSLDVHQGENSHVATSASIPAHEGYDSYVPDIHGASSSMEVENIDYADIEGSSESDYDSSGCSESIFSRDSGADSSVTSFHSETSPARTFSLDDEMDITDSPTLKHDLARYVREQSDKSFIASLESSSYMTFEELSRKESNKPTSFTALPIQETLLQRYPRTTPTAASMCASSAQPSRVHRPAPVPSPSPWAIFESTPVPRQPTPSPVQNLGVTSRAYECSAPMKIVFDEQQDCWELDTGVTGDIAMNVRAELHEPVLGFGASSARMTEQRSDARGTSERRNEGKPALVSRLKRFWKP
ncbi:hypothetical protein EW145_g6180 [Phellinidium pouzarii]|uniref:Uncharacterized protein n=1 Tax=Phellinidium pouzarii TaxID=167371 RepID=A0A4S4KY07_9AGAM|nr:hypothetical protein EW145_g6180 [Phellinidium pouzarii]